MKVNIVYGCPCSGKSTYVMEHAGSSDLIFDYDKLICATTTRTMHLADRHSGHFAILGLREKLICLADENGTETFWLQCRWISDTIRAMVEGYDVEEIFIDVSLDECLNRMEADDSRPDKDEWEQIIREWFNEHGNDFNATQGGGKNMKKFWNWTNQAQTETEPGHRVLTLNGTIAEESWFDDDITPQMFREELFAGDGDVVIWLNSPGGDCIAASQIYSMLMDYKGSVTVKIDGIAASAASVIAMAGTKVLMAPTALMMIHNPATAAFGDHADMRKAIEMLEEVKESIINAYEIKTNLSRTRLSHLMDAETWMNAGKAIELGFADGILEDSRHPIDAAAYTFSSKSVESAIMNKLETKRKAAKAAEPKPTGRSVSDLMERLELLRY